MDRVKEFLARKASKLALMVVPLATMGLALPAQAGAILNIDPCIADGPCTAQQVSPSGANPELPWTQLFGNGDAASHGEGPTFELFVSGSGSGMVHGGTIPVSWDFFLSSPSGGVNVEWQVIFDLTVNGNILEFQADGTTLTNGATPVEVAGTGAIAIPSDGAVSFWTMALFTNAGDVYSVNVPGGSTLDFNASSTPEPSAVLLTGAGGLALILRRRRNVKIAP